MKMFLSDFNSKVGTEDISKPTVGDECVHEISSGNGVRVVDFATSETFNCQEYNIPVSQHS
jgi:hypothetical protein